MFCKYCGGKIDANSGVCNHCGKKPLENRKTIFFASKIKTVFVFIFIIIGVSLIYTNLYDTYNTSLSDDDTFSISNSKITKDNYNKINSGMTKSEVFNILGSNATISESETLGLGKMELYHYQETFSTTSIDICFLNGKVESKNWTEL